LEWRYDRRDACWYSSAGWCVRRCAALAPRFDGDDDTFETRYYRSDTNEEIYGL
jgi:hypothetical protein